MLSLTKLDLCYAEFPRILVATWGGTHTPNSVIERSVSASELPHSCFDDNKVICLEADPACFKGIKQNLRPFLILYRLVTERGMGKGGNISYLEFVSILGT